MKCVRGRYTFEILGSRSQSQQHVGTVVNSITVRSSKMGKKTHPSPYSNIEIKDKGTVDYYHS